MHALFTGLLATETLLQLVAGMSHAGALRVGCFAAAGLFGVTTALHWRRDPRWWATGLVATLISQLWLVWSWDQLAWHSAVHAVVLLGVMYGMASVGPTSLLARYRHDVLPRMVGPRDPSMVTTADLARLPPLLQRFLRRAEVVGKPRVHHVRAHWRGRIRSDPDSPWMPFEATQVNHLTEPARLFYMRARRGGLPVDVYHAYRGTEATMEVRLLSLFPMVDLDGDGLTRAETVTLFNDAVILAPGCLVDLPVRWEEEQGQTIRGYYTVGRHTVSATLIFDDTGDLIDFVSDDRAVLEADGHSLSDRRWSTPLGDHETLETGRLPVRGSACWHTDQGLFTYLELELVGHEMNPEPDPDWPRGLTAHKLRVGSKQEGSHGPTHRGGVRR